MSDLDGHQDSVDGDIDVDFVTTLVDELYGNLVPFVKGIHHAESAEHLNGSRHGNSSVSGVRLSRTRWFCEKLIYIYH